MPAVLPTPKPTEQQRAYYLRLAHWLERTSGQVGTDQRRHAAALLHAGVPDGESVLLAFDGVAIEHRDPGSMVGGKGLLVVTDTSVRFIGTHRGEARAYTWPMATVERRSVESGRLVVVKVASQVFEYTLTPADPFETAVIAAALDWAKVIPERPDAAIDQLREAAQG